MLREGVLVYHSVRTLVGMNWLASGWWWMFAGCRRFWCQLPLGNVAYYSAEANDGQIGSGYAGSRLPNFLFFLKFMGFAFWLYLYYHLVIFWVHLLILSILLLVKFNYKHLYFTTVPGIHMHLELHLLHFLFLLMAIIYWVLYLGKPLINRLIYSIN